MTVGEFFLIFARYGGGASPALVRSRSKNENRSPSRDAGLTPRLKFLVTGRRSGQIGSEGGKMKAPRVRGFHSIILTDAVMVKPRAGAKG